MAITAHKLRRLEVWSNWKAAGGERLAVVSDFLGAVVTSNIAGSDQLAVRVPSSSLSAPYILPGAILRVDQDDTTFDEWKILDGPDDEDSAENPGILTVVASPFRNTGLVDADIVRRIDSDGVHVPDFESVGLTPTEQITAWVLPALARAGLSFVAIGTITPTARIDLTFSWDSPLAVLQRIADATEMELDIRRNGTTGYLIDIIAAVGSTQPTADVRIGKNLVALRRTRSGLDQATRVFPQGANNGDAGYATMSRATWRIANIAGSVLTLEDAAGGAGPIMFDNQLTGENGTAAAYLRKPNGTLTLVTASSRSAQTVTVASATGLATGNMIQFRSSSGGADLISLDSPPDFLLYGLRAGKVLAPDVPGANNLVQNSVARAWPGSSSAPPTNWNLVGAPTIGKQSVAPYTRVGGNSIEVTASADGQGVKTDAVSIFPTANNPFVSGYVQVWGVAGQFRVDLIFTTPGGTVIEPVLPKAATNTVNGQFVDLGVAGIDANVIGATAVAIRVVQHGLVAAHFYVDAAQITETVTQQPFVEGSGGTRLWQIANERLRTNGAPLVSYEVPIADLAEIDPTTWSSERVHVGATVRVTDANLGVAITTRIVEIQRDYSTPGATTVTLSNKVDDLTGTLARPSAPGKGTPDVGDGSTPSTAKMALLNVRIVEEDETTYTFGWTRPAGVTSVEAGYDTFPVPAPDDFFTLVAVADLGADDFIVVDKPLEANTVALVIHPYVGTEIGQPEEIVIHAQPSQVPAIELDDEETPLVGTQWWKITERGLAVTTVEVQEQIGYDAISAFIAPTRGPGDASTVRGGLLGAGEYEHDITLDPNRFSWIMPRLTLSNAQQIILGPFGFDRGKTPDFLSVNVRGTEIEVLADSADTRSIRIYQEGGTWEYVVDGRSAFADVSEEGTNAVAGLGASDPSTPYVIELRSDATADVDGGTIIVSRTVTIAGTSSTPPAATWTKIGLRLLAPAIGDDEAEIILQATGAPTDWYVKIYANMSYITETATTDVTADVATEPLAPPTTLDSFFLPTSYVRTDGSTGILHTLNVRADLMNDLDELVDTRSAHVEWYAGLQS